MSSIRSVPIRIVCPDWCERTPEEHAEDLWQNGGNCLHSATRAVEDTTGHREPLTEPRFAAPIVVTLSTCQAPDGAESASPVVILSNGAEFTAQQALDLADAIQGLVVSYRLGGGGS